jgi:hypothetical protein
MTQAMADVHVTALNEGRSFTLDFPDGIQEPELWSVMRALNTKAGVYHFLRQANQVICTLIPKRPYEPEEISGALGQEKFKMTLIA